MSDEAKKLLTDIFESIRLIEQYTAGKLGSSATRKTAS